MSSETNSDEMNGEMNGAESLVRTLIDGGVNVCFTKVLIVIAIIAIFTWVVHVVVSTKVCYEIFNCIAI